MSIRFRRDGSEVEAQEGQSVASALWAHGDRALSRSLKFHRPRGYLCGTGKCNQCMMRVDGVPNVKTCMVPARERMVVEGQNAWPSVRRDVFRVADVVFRKEFDHHRAFIRPRFLYPLFSKVIRAFAGWGRLPADEGPRAGVEVARPDVLVIGGGPAGLAAAVAAAAAGAETYLFDDRRALGGTARVLSGEVDDPDNGGEVPVLGLVARWEEEAKRTDGLTVHDGMAVSAVYREGLVLAQSRRRALALAPKAIVVANGAHESQGVFVGNDLPGVLTATGCLTLLRDGVLPGELAVVYGAGPHGVHVAEALHAAGVEVAGVVSTRADVDPELAARLGRIEVPLWADAEVVAAKGWGRVRSVIVRADGQVVKVRADTLVVALGMKTAPEVFQSLGAGLRHDVWQGGAVPVLDQDLMTTVPGLYAAGDCAGVGTLMTARASGRLAGLAAAAYAGHAVSGLDAEKDRLRASLGRDLLHEGGPAVGGGARAVEVPA